MTGLPRLPEPPFRRAVPTTPADRAGARVDCFPAHAAFPKWQEGQPPHCHFRGLLRLHSRYGPPDRSATQGDLCHEAPAQPVTQPSRSSASGPIDNYPGGILLHRCFTPSGRTAKTRLMHRSKQRTRVARGHTALMRLMSQNKPSICRSEICAPSGTVGWVAMIVGSARVTRCDAGALLALPVALLIGSRRLPKQIDPAPQAKSPATCSVERGSSSADFCPATPGSYTRC